MFSHPTNTTSFLLVLIAALIFSLSQSGVAAAQPFPDYRDGDKPSDWTGRVFKLSQDYPTTLPAAETLAVRDHGL